MSKQLGLVSGGIAVLLVLVGAANFSHAAVTMSMAVQTSHTSPMTWDDSITSWPSPPTVDVTVDAANPGVYINVTEGNLGNAFEGFIFSQSFTATNSGKLTKVQFPFTGDVTLGNHTLQMNVYDGLTTNWANIGAFDWDMDMNPDPYRIGIDVSNNLLTDTSFKTWAGYTIMGSTAAVMDFSLTGVDQVDIVAGKQYIVEFVLGEDPLNRFLLGRNGQSGDNSTDYEGGQAFHHREPLNGNNRRDFAMAFTITPPASTLAADFNSVDGVTGADLAIWRNGFGIQTGATKAQGNANPGVGVGQDGDVDGDDFLIWQRQLGLTSAVGAATPAPEPAGAVLALVGMAAFAGIRRRRA